jgi:hypothetical protein
MASFATTSRPIVGSSRIVQHRRREIAAHPLPERELAHGGLHEIRHLEQLRELGEIFAIRRLWYRIDRS